MKFVLFHFKPIPTVDHHINKNSSVSYLIFPCEKCNGRIHYIQHILQGYYRNIL